jgi:hypothetical protein
MTASSWSGWVNFTARIIVNLLWAAQYPAYKIASDHMGVASLSFWTLLFAIVKERIAAFDAEEWRIPQASMTEGGTMPKTPRRADCQNAFPVRDLLNRCRGVLRET